ncbi:spore germination protein GerPC [Fervidibacillus halotolerans]|uniref:Spore germination protein GerPC n=1 Tax=Fervidibacillus halotolerans TaxID=2980027 RepID=A0A9E8M0N6_9BACI|nr:spore germination protein GerPC [Fervidibacillus halotolerans]WAA13039.1 spore germination protein GerPC [Fervidibacillus halotolerans]
MQKDIFYYYHQIINKVNQQDEIIREIKQKQSLLEQELEKMKNEPTINIERIDYQFDQLKIERLEGTLNIGINPNDLQELDEFSIGHPRFQSNSPSQSEIIQKVEQRLNDYLEKEWPTFIDKTLNELKINIDSSYIDFIKEDIERQLSSRISYYLQRFNTDPGSSEDHLEEKLFSTIKSDIERAVLTFFNQNQKKGDSKDS